MATFLLPLNNFFCSLKNIGLTDLTIFDLVLNDEYIIALTNTQGVFHYALSDLD
jgi:hypothetical protein